VVLGWLRQQNHWLLVLDNLDDISVAKGYLPEWSEGRHTLITTRNPFSKDIPADGFEIPLFGSEEAIELLRVRSEVIPSEFNPAVASKIVVELDRLPLAIEHAAAFIRKATKSLQDFLLVYRKSRNSLLRRKPVGNAEYPNSLATTFLISFNKVKEMDKGAQAESLLQLLSFLNPDGISIEFLRAGGAALSIAMRDLISDEVLFYETLETLEQFSLIRRSKGDTIVIHRLIQAVVKEDLGEAELGSWRIELGNLCDAAFPSEVKMDEPFSNDVLPRCRLMSIQILYPILDAAEIYSEKIASTLRRVAWFLVEDGEFADSARLVERSIAIYKHLVGDEGDKTLRAELRLCRIYRAQGRLKDALALAIHVLAAVERIPGEEFSELTLTTKAELAVIYRTMGKLVEAAALLEIVLEARQRILGEEHLDTVTAKCNVASTYWTMGKLVEAAALQEIVVEARQRILGEEHQSTLSAKTPLASIYWNMGKLVEAAVLQENVLKASQRILGERSIQTLWWQRATLLQPTGLWGSWWKRQPY
jgi:tetratricopeptide (TPR) repeat protein